MTAAGEPQRERLGGLPIGPGDLLLGRYRIERLIGEGGTGILLSAMHVDIEQRVAIKFLKPALENSELRARFAREARAMESIDSEHVVLVLDTGVLDDGAPFVVMEYLEGRDLARVVKEDGPLPVERAVACMMQVCEALDRAHAAGVIHRDLKPANLFLIERQGAVHVKVVDFGLSKLVTQSVRDQPDIADFSHESEMTGLYTMIGSPRYAAPEQRRSSKDVDARADLWSVGAVLFNLLSGQYAFEGEMQAQAGVDADRQPRSLRALAPHVSEELESVVRRCLETDVARRFQCASDLGAALRPFAPPRSDDRGGSPAGEGSAEGEGEAEGERAGAADEWRASTEPMSVPAVQLGRAGGGVAARRSHFFLAVATLLVVLGGLAGLRRLTASSRALPLGRAVASTAPPAATPASTLASSATVSAVGLDAGKRSP